MKWPWTQRPEESTAEKAREEAKVNLADTRDRWPEVHRVSTSLRALRERNHFAEQIELAMRRQR